MSSFQFLPLGQASDVMDEIKSSYHSIAIESPRNGSVFADEEQIPINFTVDYIFTERLVPWRVLSKLYYSIDSEAARTIMQIDYGYKTPVPYRNSTDIDISSLSNGIHTLKIVATFSVDVGHVYVNSYNLSSSPISFSIHNKTPMSSSSPTPSTTLIPSPSIPEFSWLTILPLLLVIPFVLIIVRKRLHSET